MDDLTRPLIFLPNAPDSLRFTSKYSRGSNTIYPDRDRVGQINETNIFLMNKRFVF